MRAGVNKRLYLEAPGLVLEQQGDRTVVGVLTTADGARGGGARRHRVVQAPTARRHQ
jgi:hypothetical protein